MSDDRTIGAFGAAKEGVQPMAPDHAPGGEAKIGTGAFSAWARAGLKELTQALPAFPDSTIRPIEEPGLFGNPTPQLVTAEMTAGLDAKLAEITAQYTPPAQSRGEGPER